MLDCVTADRPTYALRGPQGTFPIVARSAGGERSWGAEAAMPTAALTCWRRSSPTRRTSVPVLRVDGGMSANATFLQALGDATGRPVEPAAVCEATTLGAAFLAGTTVGI